MASIPKAVIMRIELRALSANAATVAKAVADTINRYVMFLIKMVMPQKITGISKSMGRAKLHPLAKASAKPDIVMAPD